MAAAAPAAFAGSRRRPGPGSTMPRRPRGVRPREDETTRDETGRGNEAGRNKGGGEEGQCSKVFESHLPGPSGQSFATASYRIVQERGSAGEGGQVWWAGEEDMELRQKRRCLSAADQGTGKPIKQLGSLVSLEGLAVTVCLPNLQIAQKTKHLLRYLQSRLYSRQVPSLQLRAEHTKKTLISFGYGTCRAPQPLQMLPTCRRPVAIDSRSMSHIDRMSHVPAAVVAFFVWRPCRGKKKLISMQSAVGNAERVGAMKESLRIPEMHTYFPTTPYILIHRYLLTYAVYIFILMIGT